MTNQKRVFGNSLVQLDSGAIKVESWPIRKEYLVTV